MKTLLLSTEEIQNFSKLIGDPNAAVQLSSTSGQTAGCNLMALQYYLKHPGNYPVATAHTQLAQSSAIAAQATQQNTQPQTQKHMLLKQPSMPHSNYHPHHHQHHHQHHHHPYYQQHTSAAGTPTSTHARTQNHSSGNSKSNATLPVHALNQNSNFSAASSSTGGGTISSHAPTQQSNTTNSSLSPPSSTIVAVAAAAKANTAAAGRNASSAAGTKAATASRAGGATGGGSATSAAKKVKTEPILSQIHQNERLTFANAHIAWSEEHWKRVVFHDERKFNLDGPDGFSYYFHDLRNHERSLSQRPRGNSVFIYIVITAGGPVHLEISTGKLKPETYVETILRERPNIISKLGGPEFVLQDHNWTTNSLPSTQEWLTAESVKTQRWPTIAHDLNIMENVWGWLIREVYDGGRKFSRKDDLIFRIREAWARLPMDLINNLYTTLPERTMELYYTRGIYTNC